MLCCSWTDGQGTASGEKPRTVTGCNIPEMLNSPLAIVQHRKVSGEGERKCTSLRLQEEQCPVSSDPHPEKKLSGCSIIIQNISDEMREEGSSWQQHKSGAGRELKHAEKSLCLGIKFI